MGGVHGMETMDAILGNTESLQDWANALPKTDIAGLTRQVASAVQALSKTTLPPLQVLAALDIVRSPLYRACQNLMQGFIRESCGITPDNEKTATTVLQLLNTCSNLYSNLIPKLQQEQAGNTFIGLALHRSLSAHIAFQQACYQLYLPIAEKQWLKLHKRFLIANQFKLASFSCEDSTLESKTPLTNQQLYCAALLLGCSRCNQLTAKEIATTAQLLYHWAALVQIGTQPPAGNSLGFVVDIRSDAAPSFQALATLNDNALPCYLRIDGLMSKLASLLETSSGNETATPAGLVSHRLLRHLQSAWGEFVQREERIGTDETVMAAIGLTDVHFHLCGEQNPDAFIGPQKMRLSIAYEEHEDVALIESRRSGDVWSKFLSKDAENLVFGATPASFDFQQRFEANSNDTGTGHPVITARMLDTSEHGCQLEWPAEVAGQLGMGELVAIRVAQYGWLPGEVAWQTREGTERIRTGIRLLSRQPIPLSGEKLMGMAGPDWLPVILLPKESGFRDNPIVLVGNSTYKNKDLVNVCQKGIEKKIQLVERTKLHASYQQFAIGFVMDQG